MKAHTSTGVRGQVRIIYLENVTVRPIHYPRPSPVSQSVLFSAHDFTIALLQIMCIRFGHFRPISLPREIHSRSNPSSCFKENSPVLESRAVSRTGLCNPCETSRFTFRTTTKIPVRRRRNSHQGCFAYHRYRASMKVPTRKRGNS